MVAVDRCPLCAEPLGNSFWECEACGAERTPHGWLSPFARQRDSSVQTRWSGFAIAGFVLALVWAFGVGSILAIVFSGIARQQTTKRGDRGWPLAAAGLVLGVLGLLGAVVLWVTVYRAATNNVGDVLEHDVSVGSLRVGDCFIDPGPEIAGVNTVECSAAASVVFAVEEIAPDSAPWPGETRSDALAERQCDRVAGSDDYTYYGVDRDGWIEGDRTVICFYEGTR